MLFIVEAVAIAVTRTTSAPTNNSILNVIDRWDRRFDNAREDLRVKILIDRATDISSRTPLNPLVKRPLEVLGSL